MRTEGAVLLREQASPTAPGSGKVAIYAKSDGKVYIKDDAGLETDLTATAAGGFGSVEVDLGAPARSGDFVISDGSIVAGTQIVVVQSAEVPTGKGTRYDENEMDFLELRGVVTGTGSATVYWSSRSFVKGNFKLNWSTS